jgi:molybdate transport system substrate-binding protein
MAGTAATLALTLLFTLGVADAADVKLLSSAAFEPVLEVFGPQFESATGNKLMPTFLLTPEVPKLVERGEVFDVAIANPPHIEALIKSGKIVAASRTEVARFGLGVGVRSDAARPKVASVEDFKQALLKAKSVAYVEGGTGGPFFLGLLERLGIASDMEDKLRPGSSAESISTVAKGEVEMVVRPVPLILATSGVELAGAVPTEYQDHIVLVAGLSAAAPQAAAGQALIEYLRTADPDVLKAKGYERTVNNCRDGATLSRLIR